MSGKPLVMSGKPLVMSGNYTAGIEIEHNISKPLVRKKLHLHIFLIHGYLRSRFLDVMCVLQDIMSIRNVYTCILKALICIWKPEIPDV